LNGPVTAACYRPFACGLTHSPCLPRVKCGADLVSVAEAKEPLTDYPMGETCQETTSNRSASSIVARDRCVSGTSRLPHIATYLRQSHKFDTRFTIAEVVANLGLDLEAEHPIQSQGVVVLGVCHQFEPHGISELPD
jgi:hypothetical protein